MTSRVPGVVEVAAGLATSKARTGSLYGERVSSIRFPTVASSTRTVPVPLRPTVPLAVLAGAMAVEGTALVVIGLVVLVDALVGAAHAAVRETLLFVSLAALFGLYGGTLLAAARAALRRRRWARALAVLSQIVALLMGWQIATWGLWPVGVPLALLGGVALVLALTPLAGGLLVETAASDQRG